MKALFVLKDENGKTVKELVFDNKEKAKIKRKELNPVSKETEKEIFLYTITYGPDHRLFQR